MSEQLSRMVRDYRLKLGRRGRERLAIKADISPSTLVQIEKHGHVPLPEAVRRIALACDRTEAEADALAREASEARETA